MASPQVQYFTPDWAPPGKRMFVCERLSATLGTEQCATNWSRATAGDGMLRCKGCRVGACHAGQDRANASPLRGMLICARCQRGCNRLVENWNFVSCYNRGREWRMQRNAKGSFPSRMTPLVPREVTYTEAGQPRVLRRVWSQSREELVFGLLRDCTGEVAIAFNGRVNLAGAAGTPQAALW